jgi:hypothetical protein
VKPAVGWTTMTETASLAGSADAVAMNDDTAIVGVSDTLVSEAFVYDLLPATYPGDIDGDHDVDNADTTLFADVLIGLDTDVIHVGRADMDCSGTADGLDLQPFVDLLLD